MNEYRGNKSSLYNKGKKMLASCLIMMLLVNGVTVFKSEAATTTYDYESGATFVGKTASQVVNGETLIAETQVDDAYNDNDINGTGNRILVGISQVEPLITFRLASGKQFDLNSIFLGDYSGGKAGPVGENWNTLFKLTSSKGTISTRIPQFMESNNVDISADPNADYFRGITSFTITSDSYQGGGDTLVLNEMIAAYFDNIVLNNITAPAGNATASAGAATLTPVVGIDNAITLTVKDSLGNTDTAFSGAKNVTITGLEAAPDSSYGSFNGTALDASSAVVGQAVSVTFASGVATPNLALNKADAQTIGFSVDTVTTPGTNTLTITPSHGAKASMTVSQNITAPGTNGGNFAQQPIVTLLDAFGNTCSSDSLTSVTAARKDAGAWTLTGTTGVTASSGVATFTDLGATNSALVNNAQLGFTSAALTEVTSATVTLPAPSGNHTATAGATTLTPVVDVDDAITLTVKNSLGNTDTAFSGAKNVTITGVEAAPDSSYGSFNGTALDANSAGAGQVISVTFASGVATPNLKLNKADAQTIGFSIATVTTPATNTLTITPSHGVAASMTLTQNITAPATNGGNFAQQPVITLKDAFGNTCTSDNSTVVTAAKEDAGTWTLTGTAGVTASSGIVTFTNLGATNVALVNNAQLGFTSGAMTKITSSTVTLPAPSGNHTATAGATTLTPVVDVNDVITLTVKNSLGNTDTAFSGAKNVTITGVEVAPDGSYGSFNGNALDANSAGAGQVISVTFNSGVATPNLKLNKADAQTLGFSIATVTTPATNTLTITPSHGIAASMTITQDITAPASNGGNFAQQPFITLKDAFGNICTSDNSTVVTAAKEDAGTWTLTGTAAKTVVSGVATFTNLGATNGALVNNAQLGFTSGALTKVTSAMVDLPTPAGNHTGVASATTLTPAVGVDDSITLTVKNSLGNTDTAFSGAKNVTITGVEVAPDGSYGSFDGNALDANSAGAGQVISVTFTSGVATPNLKLNKADAQTLGFSIATVTTPATNTLTITPAHGAAATMAVSQDITAPASNGGNFAQQPVITLKDAFGNVCTTDSTTVVTAAKEDAGTWTLTGTAAKTVVSGVATFTNLGATNGALVNNAQLGFTSGALTKVTSATVDLPTPAGNHTGVASATTLTPAVGVDDSITLTVKNTLGNTDTAFSGAKNVTITGVEVAPDGSYGSFNGTALDANAAGAGQVISVTFTSGVGTANLKLNKADAQTLGFSIATVTTPATNTLTITPAHGAAATMAVSQDITVPASNGGNFAQQPIVTIIDAFGNICTSDNASVVTAAKEDAGTWTLTGTAAKTVVSGVATFTNLGATNGALVNNAQLGFTSGALTKITSVTVNLPAPVGNHTATSSAASLTPVVDANNAITLTVKNSLGNTDTAFSGPKNVTITGVEVAPDGTYGGFNTTALDANSAGAGQTISVMFTNGVATPSLQLNKADAQTIGFSIETVTTPATNTLTITPTHGVTTAMVVTQDITAPASNGGNFAQQPRITLKDAFGNICSTDSTTVVTAANEDGGAWTLTGTTGVTASSGVVTFTNLGATNLALVNNAQLGFTSAPMTKVTSTTVTLPAPVGNHTAVASAATLTPSFLTDNEITLTVKNSLGNTDTAFTGTKNVTITGVEASPTGAYGRFGGVELDLTSAGAGQVIPVTFTNGVGKANLTLYKADAQTIGFSVATVATPATNTVTITPAHGTAAIMVVTQNITAPATNGGNFAQQPKVTLKDSYGNVCTSDNATVVTAQKQDAGTWTLKGTLTATVVSGVATFTNLGATNTALVGHALVGFTSGSMPLVTSADVSLPAPSSSSGGGSSDRGTSGGGGGGASAPSQTSQNTVVIVNGKSQSAGSETVTVESGKSTVTVKMENQVIQSKIDEAIKNNTSGAENTLQVPVGDTKSAVAKVELTGDIVKKLEENTFDVSIKRDNVEYVIPAEEFTISKVADKLGVQEKDLKDIKIEVQISKLDDAVVAKYNEVAKSNGAEIVFSPVEFEVVAKTTKKDGTVGSVEINKFSNYVERVMEVPSGVDPSKVTTGIVFNADGTYSHVPTKVFQKDGKWYAQLNSLTNSNYSIIWNPVTVKSVENHWSKSAVNDMASRLIVFNGETFDPNKAITRADFAEYIVRALGLYREGSAHVNNFKDVSASGDRTLAILIANEYGIVSGYSDGTFRGDNPITREEAMAMYQRAMKIVKLSGTDKERYKNYTDFDTVGSWAVEYVKEALAAHVFNGTSATTLSPKEKLTYGEAAQAIKNLLVESNLINK